MPLPQDKKHYAYADYITWGDENRCELIDGQIYLMAPAPSLSHQRLSKTLFRILDGYLAGHSCEAFYAPVDVRLNADAGDDTVVQPDLFVVCDPNKLSDRGCKGAPDLVIEILSPSSAGYDSIIKLQKYMEAGVREYWLVNADNRSIVKFHWVEGQYIASSYEGETSISVSVFDGFSIALSDIFG